jgi:DNA modification methylase
MHDWITFGSSADANSAHSMKSDCPARPWIVWPSASAKCDPFAGSDRDKAPTIRGQARFFTGDALTELSKLGDQSVDTVITSPPYFPAMRDYGKNTREQLGCEGTSRRYIIRLTDIFSEVRRVLKNNGILWLVIGDGYSSGGGSQSGESMHTARPHKQKSAIKGVTRQNTSRERPPKSLLGIPHRLVEALQDDGWLLRDEVIWCKSAPRPESAADRCTRAHEFVFMLTKSQKYFFDATLNREPAVTKPHGAGYRKINGIMRNGLADDGRVRGSEGFRNRRSVWHLGPDPYRGPHPAPFPRELVRRMLLPSCPPGGVVLDPFGGAGTTALVAAEHGFESIYIDSNPTYAEGAERRVSERSNRRRM